MSGTPTRDVPLMKFLIPFIRYQWLNHYALFSGGYREDALECMEKLVQKYGKEEEDDEDDSDLS